ncbi:outer membrane lipoprotein carrier protein LolA [Thalassorhabdus alkalitolerans]|uniref:Outer membrane lipoprotein carrier protein LolA n=1 Tax=Thalassorhabdus alkalitolerans TaxID=2282697 RepID=A0ABW0YUL5_9BACI|nr:outer membrane lipoprotein carrier protein LolA [Thalassobacillus sp. C254]
MRKRWLLCLTMIVLVITVTACGEKSQEDVVKDLDKTLQEMSGYQAEATMALQTGQEPRSYEVDVWHMQNEKNKYYRVALKNDNEEQNQMIIRNDDGVFVLTPALNKSFRFQSDWPNNNSQVYLYESLISDILMDAERTFAVHEDKYVFETKTNYQNKNLHHQEITLDSKSLVPVSVKIYDPDYELLVEVTFTNFEMNKSFDEADFDTEKNMTAADWEVPAMADEAPEGTETVIEEEQQSEEFAVAYPTYEPQGSSLTDSEEIQGEDGKRVILSYTGEKSFTIIQEEAQTVPAMAEVEVGAGDPVDLTFTVGIQTEDSLSWTYDGVDYFLASNDLSPEEMMAVARSMEGTMVK